MSTQTGDLTVTLNGRGPVAVRSLDELRRDYWTVVRAERFADLWLRRSSGTALSVLVSGNAALVLFFRYEGDAGFTSRGFAGADDKWTNATPVLAFRLGNGQEDEYPASWTVSIETAIKAAERFFTHGDKSPDIVWHEES